MLIPLVDLSAQNASVAAEIRGAMAAVIDNSRLILGSEVAQLEAEFAAYCGVSTGVGVASGTSALHLALVACGVGPGDEVITTPHTFIATAEAIWQAGAKPVFADIDPATYNIDPEGVERAITSKTRAIVPVHLYGHAADMGPIMKLADRYGLKVIEDAAQAHGARLNGSRVGSIGDIGCFSFYPGKNLGAYGDAGIVVTDDPDLAGQVALLRNHGRKDKYEHLRMGFGERLDTLQAAVLRVKLKYLDEWNERRTWAAGRYRDYLSGVKGITLPWEKADVEPVYHLFVMRVGRRDDVLSDLRSAGIGAGVHYSIALHMQPALSWLGHKKGDFPHAEQVAEEVLSLPLFPEIREGQIEVVAGALVDAVRKRGAISSAREDA